MEIRAIRTEENYDQAFMRLEEIFHAEIDWREGEEAEILGFKSRVSEILNRRRKLMLNMIRRLSDQLKIPIKVLIQNY